MTPGSVLSAFYPLTRAVQLLQCDASVAANATAESLRRAASPNEIRKNPLYGPGLAPVPDEPPYTVTLERLAAASLEDALGYLLPATAGTRYVFLNTVANGWCAFYFNASRSNGDRALVLNLAEQLKCRAIYTMAQPNTISTDGRSGSYGAFQMFVYNGQREPERVIALINDSGKWRFVQKGQPYPFEDESAYRRRRIQDRFNETDLQSVLAGFGLNPFEDRFYVPTNLYRVNLRYSESHPVFSRQYDLEVLRRRMLNTGDAVS